MPLAISLNNAAMEAFWKKCVDAIPSILGAILILALGFWFSNMIGKLVVRAMKKRGVDASAHGFIKSIVVLVLRFVVVLSSLSTLGLDINSFIAALGAAGVTAGIGLKDSISQFASGLEILFNKPFKSGDYIEVGSVEGTVEQIRLMDTTLRTYDNKAVILPNSQVTSTPIINYTAQNSRRLDIDYKIAAPEDIVLAKDIILRLAAQTDGILQEPAPFVAVKSQDHEGLTLTAQLWCEVSAYWSVCYSMQESVRISMAQEGVRFPGSAVDLRVIEKEAAGS